MEIQNRLLEESLRCRQAGRGIASRGSELSALFDVSEYCSRLKEKIRYDGSCLFDQEVEPGVDLGTWLFQHGISSDEEARGLLMRMIEQLWKEGLPDEDQETILCALGSQEAAAHDMESYIGKRREVLSGIPDPKEYARIMRTCFLNSRFADDIEIEMQNIEDFPLHTEELTLNLSVLNDEALAIYEKHNHDGNLAMRELGSKLRACSPDYKNQKKLQYEFSYEVEEDGKKAVKSKKVICHPHLKLVKEHSDFRIYFAWKDDEVGAGNHVLVGRIGRHGW